MKVLLLSVFCFVSLISFAQKDEDHPEYLLKSIYFGGGSYEVDEHQLAELIHLIDSVENIKDYTITIHSHTDNIGGVEFNEWLSKMRSESVIQELLNVDFSLSQIQIKDFGQFNPVFDNSTWEGRRKNRRVDVIFWPIVF